jgi:hypothetical protein
MDVCVGQKSFVQTAIRTTPRLGTEAVSLRPGQAGRLAGINAHLLHNHKAAGNSKHGVARQAHEPRARE